MPRAKRLLVILLSCAAAGLAVVPAMASTRAPRGEPLPAPIAADLLPTPAETAAYALRDWIDQHPSPTAGTVAVEDDLTNVSLYWKGAPPAELQNLASQQPAPVAVRQSRYTEAEIGAERDALMNEYRSWINYVVPTKDLNGLTVSLKPAAPSNALTTMISKKAVPLTHAQGSGVEPAARNNDRAPWYGGSLIINQTFGDVCSTGAGVYIGSTSYVSTAWHCKVGIYRSYNSNAGVFHSLGAVKKANYTQDIQLFQVSSGPWMFLGNWESPRPPASSARRRPSGEPALGSAVDASDQPTTATLGTCPASE